MTHGALTPLGASLRGLVSGAVGTAAMTGAQTAYYKATGSESSSTPAEVGKRIGEGVLHREVPDEQMSTLNQVMHWGYGTAWGLPFGLLAGSRRAPGSLLTGGAALALAVWASSRAELTAMKLAPPPWQDPPSSLAVDVGAHAVYGLVTALAFRVLR